MRRYRQHSKFVDPAQFGRPLNRDERHRILWCAERLSLRRVEGRRSHLISPYTLQVLRVLLSFVGKDGSCCPSLATLQERTDFSRNTILKALRQLEACSLLSKARRIVRRAVHRVNGFTGRQVDRATFANRAPSRLSLLDGHLDVLSDRVTRENKG